MTGCDCRPTAGGKRIVLAIAAALVLPALLAGIGLGLEYHDQYISSRIGQYLLLHNDQRPQQGAIWDAIRDNRSGRLGLLTVRPGGIDPESIDPGSIPAALLRWDYSVEMGPTSIVLESSPRGSIIEPGHARRDEIQALASSLRAYRLGQDLLHKAAFGTDQYERRADHLLDSLLSDGGLFVMIDQRLATEQAHDSYILARMPRREQLLWQRRLAKWRRGTGRQRSYRSGVADSANAAGAAVADRDRGGTQEQLYREICRELLDSWSDSLYTKDFLRLTDGWSNGGGYSAMATREQADWQGRAYMGNGDVLEFVIPTAVEPEPVDSTQTESP
jgi:hypothetical protein